MISPMLALELRKQRKYFVNLLLILSLSFIVFSAIVALMKHTFSMQTLEAYLVVAFVGGVPLFAILFSTLPGHHLHSDRESEQVLPATSVNRILSAYAASFFYFVVISSVVIGLTYFVAPSLIPETLSQFSNR